MKRALTIFGAVALLAATAGVASADVSGTVSHVNAQSNIVHFTDGRIVYLEPGATFMVDGRVVSIAQVRPGMRVALSGARDAQSAAAPAAVAPLTSHPAVDASGTVARFDPQTNMVTFEDGRMISLGAQSTVWQQGPRASIRPGERIFVRNAQPAGWNTAWDAAAMPRHRMGTVVSVDPANALVILNDGTVVRVSPATRVHLEGQPMTLSNLRPGDELVIVGTSPAASGNAGGMAMPRTDTSASSTRQLPPYFGATFDATEIHLMRRAQAP